MRGSCSALAFGNHLFLPLIQAHEKAHVLKLGLWDHRGLLYRGTRDVQMDDPELISIFLDVAHNCTEGVCSDEKWWLGQRGGGPLCSRLFSVEAQLFLHIWKLKRGFN